MLKDEPYPDDGVLTVPLLKHQVPFENWFGEYRKLLTNQSFCYLTPYSVTIFA